MDFYLDNPSLRTLAARSDERKSYLLTQLKSLIVQFSCPLLYLTINPNERYNSIALLYAVEEIDVRTFQSQMYSLSKRLKSTLKSPLAVIEYFHNMIKNIFDSIIKEGIFWRSVALLCHY
jgi:Helitron helicase-like domain at N-terminus